MVSSGDSLDLDQLRYLARKDPVAFEDRRRELIEAVIARAPERRRRRLRGLQWRVDVVRNRSSCPLEACISLSEMMWESFAGTNGLREALKGQSIPLERGAVAENVVPMPQKGRDQA
jgi:hypothetical protein